MDQGFDSNGKRQTARLPFTSGGLSGGGQSLGSQRFNQNDVYATRIGDDFDDVLDVPIQSQSGYQTVDETPQAPIFEDVFTSGQNQDQPSPYDYAAYDKPSAPLDAFGAPGARQRDPQDYIEPAEQEFVGWPVLPDGPEEDEEEAKSGRGGLFLRLGLIIGLFGVVCFWAYYFLGDYIAKRRSVHEQSSAKTTEVANAGDSGSSTVTPAEPQVASGSVEEKNKPGGESISPEPPPQTTSESEKTVSPPPLRKTGIVKPNELSTTQKNPPPRPVNSSRGGTTIQVGSFKDQGEADAKAASLNAATNGEFRVVRAEIPGRGVWYRVQQAEGFASREAAVSYGNRLRARNLISDFIVTTR